MHAASGCGVSSPSLRPQLAWRILRPVPRSGSGSTWVVSTSSNCTELTGVFPLQAFNVLAIPFIYFLCPETAGKQLEELDVLFCKPELRERIANERAAVIDAAMKRAEEQLGQGPLATPEEKKDELRHELVA